MQQKVGKCAMRYARKNAMEKMRWNVPSFTNESLRIMFLSRDDYDYSQKLGTRQLPPLEVGEDNSNLGPKKLRKIQIHQYGETKGRFGVFRHDESKSGLYFVLTLLLHKLLAT